MDRMEAIVTALALKRAELVDRENGGFELKIGRIAEIALGALKQSDLDTEIWNQIGDLIEAAPKDGKNAEGGTSEIVLANQRGFIEGLRSARLRAIKIVRELQPKK